MESDSFIDKLEELGGSAATVEKAADVLRESLDFFGDDIAFATSFGAEDQGITDLLFRQISTFSTFRIFTLDTGRIAQETYDVFEATRKRYGVSIKIRFSDRQQVEAMVNQYGPNLFYDSVEQRKLCCKIRKIEPLKRELSVLKAFL